MNAQQQVPSTASIDGYVVDRGEGHSIAIYDRNGVSWVAEFRGGRAEVMNADTWYYFHAEQLGYWRRSSGSTCSKPLSARLREEIERLHEEMDARPVASAVHHCKTSLAEAAARLGRAVATLDEAGHESVPHGPRTMLGAITGAAAQGVSRMLSAMRRLPSKTSRA